MRTGAEGYIYECEGRALVASQFRRYLLRLAPACVHVACEIRNPSPSGVGLLD